MRIALVIPRNAVEGEKSFYDYSYYRKFLFARKYFSYMLAAPTLAALTPPEHDVRIFDENIEEIDYGWPADLAGITARTMFAPRAYAISERYRGVGVKTVLGGIHPSMLPGEAGEHCDSVVVGEAEELWPELLEDAEAGRLKPVYRAAGPSDLTLAPAPDRDALSLEKYYADVLQTTKGCPYDCEFCSVSVFDGRRLRSKTVEQVVQEVQTIHRSANPYKKKSIFFADDNLVADRKYARSLFRALAPYGLNWSCQGSINVSRDGELLALMKEAGCGAILVGLESIDEGNLAVMGKKVNMKHDYLEAVRTIQSHGIMVHGSFVLGYDFDTPACFDELVQFIDEAELLMPLVNILTPFPGTKLFERLSREGRLLHRDWSRYDGTKVVFRPARMSEEELQAGFRRVVQKVYSLDRVYRRLSAMWERDFWRRSNEKDPIGTRHRLLFAARLCSLVPSGSREMRRFVRRVLPRIFEERVRISTILTLLAYHDFAFSLSSKKGDSPPFRGATRAEEKADGR